MESVQKYYGISVTKRLLLLIGQWPYQEKRTKLFRMSILTVTIISMIAPQVAKIIQCNGNTRCILLTTPALMLMTMILAKLYTCQFNRNKIKILTDHLVSDWEKLKNAEEYEIMKTYAANARLLSLAYCLFYYIVSSTFVLISLISPIMNIILPLNQSRPILMPYEAYYYVDGEKYFFYIFFHTFVSLAISLTAALAHDCMLLVYIEHVCSIFAVAGFRFGTLSQNNHDVMNKSLDDVYDQKIADSVYAHRQALWFAELLENTFCVAFGVQIIIVTITMSISLLQIAMQIETMAETIRYTAYLVSQLVHLFCYSLQGQKLIDHSLQVRNKIYNSSWYNIPTKSQRLLLYVMRRSVQPNFLSAGKIYIFSLKSFTTVLQSSMSYFTVLASFQ